jgi:hypothetical protein
MRIKEIKDHQWMIDIEAGHIVFDMSENQAFFYKRRSKLLGDEVDEAPTREWMFDEDMSGTDVLLVIMKSLHL